MDWRRYAPITFIATCGVALTFAASCGKKNNDPNGAPNNGGSNNTSNVAPNNGTNNPANNTTGSNNATNNATNNTPVPAEFGLDERPANATCLAFDRPPSPSAVTTARAFPNISFSDPLSLMQTPSPNDTRWFVIEQAGRVMTMPDEAATAATVFVDITDRVSSGGERGLLGMAFHPDWPTTAEVFLSYTAGNQSRISRFTSPDGQTLDAASEDIVLSLTQPYSNHNGGHIGFGPDGYLYIGFGDGGSAGDPEEAGQDVDQLLGKILRIDVDGAAPYGIPANNPFANGGGAPEIFAWGLRNPWRWSFDTQTGELWAGDVGQNNIEEIDLIELGGNYGWDDKEGTRCYEAAQPCDNGPWIDPVVEYDHSQGRRSVTGGYVYRGTAIPSLNGIYIFGDYASGHVYGIFKDADGRPEMRQLFQHGGPISSFGQGQDGEVYVVDYGGSMHRIVPEAPVGADNFPYQLSDTGCLDAAGLIPYTINAPFWSDGATKERFFALPDGANITVEPSGDWTFPQGSVLVKNFYLDGRPIETRLFVHHDDGEWGGYSYEWNDAGTDATYAQGGKTKRIGNQDWIYPSSGDCMVCHTQVAGRTLGPENAQLDGDFTYASTNRVANQLKTLGHIGVFDTAPDPDVVQELVDPFGDADATARARSYLHTNCSGCHRSGTQLRPKFDLTYTTNPLIDDELCSAAAIGNDFGNSAARRLIPGDPDNSLMWIRMTRRDAGAMPPLGSNIVDQAGADLVRSWIENLGACEL